MSKLSAFGESAKGHRGRLCAALELPVHLEWKHSRDPMKLLLRTIPLFIAVATTGYSQDEIDASTSAPLSVQTATPSTARIIGNIPDGTPPPPAPPKPPFVLADKDIRSARAYEQGGRTITVREIQPIALPSPPEPPAAPAHIDPALKERLRAYYASHPRPDLLWLSATVYRSKSTPPRTLVRYWPAVGKGESVTFWSNADFALLSGIHSFVDGNGDAHSIMMGWGNIDLDREDLRTNTRWQHPVPPAMSDEKASFVIVGKSPEDPAALAPVHALHDLYNKEHARLAAAYEGREQARIQKEAELKANPPKPKNITLNYWRTETPASTTTKGGAR